jgi:hypothetical protein
VEFVVLAMYDPRTPIMLEVRATFASEISFKPMVIIAMFGGPVAGGALFAILRNSGGKGSNGRYTKLNIG